MSIIDDFAAIGGRLAEIEKTKTAADQPATAATSSTTSWMYSQIVEQAAVVWTPEHGYAIPAIDYDGA
jgi:hypothetical protein